MFTVIYGICTLIAAIVFIYMAQKNYNNVDIYQWTILVIVPIINMAYWLKSQVTQPETAHFMYCFIYLDSTILIVVVMFSLLNTLHINIHPWMKILAYGIATIQMAVVCLCAHDGLYYSNVEIVKTNLGQATLTEYGPLIPIHFAYLGAMLLWVLGVIIVSIAKSGKYDRKNLFIYLAFVSVSLFIYFFELLDGAYFTHLPIVYTIGAVIIALRYDSAHKHDLSFMIAEHQKHHQERGYLAISLERRFLGANDKCQEFISFLDQQKVNAPLSREDDIGEKLYNLTDDFEQTGNSSIRFQTEGITCVCEISAFTVSSGGKHQGYLLEFRDATEEQRAYDIISSYNETLNKEVAEKTNSILDMQQKIVLGMADMIENRDNNTGGHVKRTSDIIRIIVDEIMRQGIIPISEELAADIVRAAPTHDLGKLTIDNSILNKPGRLTDEEFAIMKTHSAKSGEFVRILLDGVEEERFVNVAYNVARFHHERWDGRGYPEGLVGTLIPIEARIMAIADVYDALVSKRVYKEPMSFEQSAAIMCENMGTQFDPNMKSVFLGCQKQLEEYYIENDR